MRLIKISIDDYILILSILCISVTGLISQENCEQVINGRILDLETQEALPYATIQVLESGQSTIADEDGSFSLIYNCNKEIHLEVRFIGYKTVQHHHDFHHGDPIILMALDEVLLESVVVEASRFAAFESVATQNLEVDKILMLSNSIGDLTKSISGVSSLSTGSNVSKPIVHGLHSNRVLVINDGLRHAFQVWGVEHAPEIDPSHVNEIEVVKGAGTVKYGPEALGGVVLYNTKRPELDNKFGGSFGSSYQTNGRVFSGQLSLSQGSHRFAWTASGFGVRQADLSAPNYSLTNTGKVEYGASFNTLYHLPNFEIQVSGSYLDQNLGVLRGALVGNLQDLQNAIERNIPSPTFEPSYSIQNPKHVVDHKLLKADLAYYVGDHVIKLRYGIQQNDRKEFDVRRGELNDRPVIDLNLISHTADFEWVQANKGIWRGSSGLQYFSQNSTNMPGSNPINFVPNYTINNIGAYSVQSFIFDNSSIEIGVRFDYQILSVIDTIRDVTFYSNNIDFKNATYTLGYLKKLSDRISIFSNLGTAWRPPNVAELYSFGYHSSRVQFGLWRYNFDPTIKTPLTEVFDETDREVRSERSLKWVSGLEIRRKKINAEFVFYINRINNYIFLRPFGVTTNVAGTFPYFLYDQTNALFMGSDLDFRYSHNKNFTSEAQISYVYANETVNDQAFIQIPPMNANYTLDYINGNWGAGIKLDYMAEQWNAPRVIEPASFQNGGAEFAQNEIFDFMDVPSDYLLIGANLSYQQKRLKIEFRADNILNTSYRSYTDRLRYFGDAVGRNFSLTAGIEF